MGEIIQEDPLDRELREAMPYIDDDGFTARVLRRLPPASRPRRGLRAVILLGSALLASVLGCILSENGRFVTITIERLATLPMIVVLALVVTSGMVMIALGVLAAMAKGDEL
jgi:hypothetical protein